MAPWENIIHNSIRKGTSAVVVKKEVASEALLGTQNARETMQFSEARMRSDSASTSSVNSLLAARTPLEDETKTRLEASLLQQHSELASRDTQVTVPPAIVL